MTHPFEHRAHYNADGKVCHCPWGIAPGHEHLGSIKIVESSKLDWLINRKGMDSPRNQKWLDYMMEGGLAHDSTDKLLPYLHREFTKGRLLPGSGDADSSNGLHYFKGDPNAFHRDGIASPYVYYDEQGRPEYVTDESAGSWLGFGDLQGLQEDLEEMKKRRQGIDLMQHTFPDMMHKVEDFRKWKGQQKRKDYGEVLHRFDNGWTVRRLQNDREHRDEGNNMSHCVGQPQYGYSQATEEGKKIYASLRDEMNHPHATMEATPDHWRHADGEETMQYPPIAADGTWIPQIGPSSEIQQFFGKNDAEPEDEHREMMNEWLHDHGHQGYEEGEQDAEYLNVPAADSVESYAGIHGEDGAFTEWADETDEHGRPPGEQTEYTFNSPEWGDIASDFLSNGPWGHGYIPQGHTPITRFNKDLRNNHHTEAFENAAREQYDPADPDHVRHWEEFQKSKEPWYHPYTGEYVEGWQEKPPLYEFQNQLMEPNPQAAQWQNRLFEPLIGPEGVHVTDPNELDYRGNPRVINQRPQGPAPNPWAYNAHLRLARNTQPLYVRWVYSPSKGVMVGSNADDHPAFVKYHQGLGGDINDTDLVHGYAYPIGNGWRITDYEHQPLGDPYISNQVVRALNVGGGPQMSSQASWQPSEYDWDRLHYGIPREKVA